MNVFYEEDGHFKVASIMSETGGALQVESQSGKRSKLKANNVLMRFEADAYGFLEAANTEALTLDTDFMWECCGETEFGFAEFAEDYYGGKPTSIEAAATAIKLHSAPIYFNRKGKGLYKAATAEVLKTAVAGLEKKRLLAEKMASFVAQLKAHELPADIATKLDMLLYAPDKNSFEYKTLDTASAETHLSHLKLLQACGAIPSAHDYHLECFLREYFPKGIDFTEYEVDEIVQELPLAESEAFSIDDATTTEIDDAFSIKNLAKGNTLVGIHIAAPALGIPVNSPLDVVVMHRLSTVYMPGNKITMMPEAAIRPFSLDAGEIKPVLSLYLEVAPDLSIVARYTKLERIKMADNLRHDTLEPFFNEATLERDSGHPYWAKLLCLFNLSESLEKIRGKHDPNKPPQIDYNFHVTAGLVSIVARRRGAPMDKLVAELMIEANNQWGALLAQHEIPGLYRAQTGGKVFMTTKAEPHIGLGVAQYAWSTSPLRRAVDLINQRQIITAIQNTEPAYPKNSPDLTTHLRNFEQTYTAYSDFQTRMERYWCLRYLVQENILEVTATVWRDNLVRLVEVPFFTKVHNLPTLKPTTRVTLQIKEIDTLLMELSTRFVAVLEEASADTVLDIELEAELEINLNLKDKSADSTKVAEAIEQPQAEIIADEVAIENSKKSEDSVK
ncbi:MAG: RNB domain-containing ribonuclease [Methylophilaceae bacterium]|nr:RNB domain-containing ribonuclease [Methylophilaceae bacterium]